MTIKELQFVLKILESIKDPDEQVEKGKAFLRKDLAIYAAKKGQLRDNYETDLHW